VPSAPGYAPFTFGEATANRFNGYNRNNNALKVDKHQRCGAFAELTASPAMLVDNVEIKLRKFCYKKDTKDGQDGKNETNCKGQEEERQGGVRVKTFQVQERKRKGTVE